MADQKGALRMKALEKMVNSGSNAVAMSNQSEMKHDKRGGLITFGIDYERATKLVLETAVAVCFIIDLKEWDAVAEEIVIDEFEMQKNAILFSYWLMENCELAEDNSLWTYHGEDYTTEGLYKIWHAQTSK